MTTLTYSRAEDAVMAEDAAARDRVAALRLVSRGMLGEILKNLSGSPLSVVTAPSQQPDGSLAVSLLVRDTFPAEYIQIIALDIGAVVLPRTTERGDTLRIDSATTTDDAMKALVRLARDQA